MQAACTAHIAGSHYVPLRPDDRSEPRPSHGGHLNNNSIMERVDWMVCSMKEKHLGACIDLVSSCYVLHALVLAIIIWRRCAKRPG